MEYDVAVAAFKLSVAHGSPIFIGGGEPTLHPRFWDLVGQCLRFNSRADYGGHMINLITNGSREEDALALAEIARAGLAYVGLSRDQFHRRWQISEKVIDAFKRESKYGSYSSRNENDGRDFRSGNIDILIPVGRGAQTWKHGHSVREKGCDGCGAMVTPDGSIWRCSCRKEKLGNVMTGIDDDIASNILYEAGCTVRDGQLLPDPNRNGIFTTRSNIEEHLPPTETVLRYDPETKQLEGELKL